MELNMIKMGTALPALALCVLFVSCRSMLNYADSSPANRANSPGAVISGYFVSKEKQHENDIVISGALVHSAWTSFVPVVGLRYKWEGVLSFSGKEQPLVMVIWHTNPNTPNQSLNPVSIRGLPGSFDCRDFPVLSGRPQFFRIETYKRIAEFALNGKKLSVEFLPKYRFQGMDNHFVMLQDKKQIIQIVDEGGKVYADFDMNSYRIYEQAAEASIEQELQMALAVFSIVQHICLELR
jgi:hypothetical protein